MCRERQIHPVAAWAAASPDSREGAGGFQLVKMNICLPRKGGIHLFLTPTLQGPALTSLCPRWEENRGYENGLEHLTPGACDSGNSTVPASQGGDLAPGSHWPCGVESVMSLTLGFVLISSESEGPLQVSSFSRWESCGIDRLSDSLFHFSFFSWTSLAETQSERDCPCWQLEACFLKSMG